MMKTKFYALLFFLTVAMSGCDNEYDDTGIRTQIAEVTDQVKALQTLTEALQNRDYILSVVPTTVEGVPGYLITFAQAEPVTILCGTSVIAAVDTLRLPMEQRPLHCPEAMPSPSDSTVTMYYIVLLPAWISHCCFPLP